MRRTTRHHARAWRTLRDWGPATAVELAVRVGMRREEARRVIRPLVRSGAVERIGTHQSRAVYQATPLPPLPPRDLDLMLWLHSYGPDTATAYADDLGLSARQAQKLANRLIDRGLLQRKRRLSLTRAGRDAVHHLTASRRPAPTSHPGGTAKGSASGAPSPRGAHLEAPCPK